jgi:hypothetical protein
MSGVAGLRVGITEALAPAKIHGVAPMRGFKAAEAALITEPLIYLLTNPTRKDQIRLVSDRVASWEWESFARREPRRARERLGPLKPRKPVAKGAD